MRISPVRDRVRQAHPRASPPASPPVTAGLSLVAACRRKAPMANAVGRRAGAPAATACADERAAARTRPTVALSRGVRCEARLGGRPPAARGRRLDAAGGHGRAKVWPSYRRRSSGTASPSEHLSGHPPTSPGERTPLAAGDSRASRLSVAGAGNFCAFFWDANGQSTGLTALRSRVAVSPAFQPVRSWCCGRRPGCGPECRARQDRGCPGSPCPGSSDSCATTWTT